MSAFIETHIPCPRPECGSTDAASKRPDGSIFCFSCGKNSNEPAPAAAATTQEETTLQRINTTVRGISPGILDAYSVRHVVSSDGTPIQYSFPRPDGQTLYRNVKDKVFRISGARGDGNPLFGSNLYPAGSGKYITITEGYFDTMAVREIMGDYPVVGVQSVTSAKSECSKAYEYLNSFERIYLCFDPDLPGQEAMDKVARLFDFNKVYVVRLDNMDPNDYLEKGLSAEFKKTWWGSKRFMPEGILSSFDEFDSIFDDDADRPSVPYPFPRLQEQTLGIRDAELVLITAQEGLGKTEIFRAIEHHLLKTTDANIGIIHLEEGKARTLKGIINYDIKVPVHLPEYALSKEDLKRSLREAIGRDDRVHIYSHFGSDDPDHILSTVRFLAGACGCRYVFLDHITMVVSGLAGEDERRALDYISTRLAMMVEELGFTLFLISHVNDDGQTRGSRNIGKVADIRIDLDRNPSAHDDIVRNTTFLNVSKNRFSGKTGPAGKLLFDTETYILEEYEGEILT